MGGGIFSELWRFRLVCLAFFGLCELKILGSVLGYQFLRLLSILVTFCDDLVSLITNKYNLKYQSICYFSLILFILEQKLADIL